MFSALAPHSNAIQALAGSSDCDGSAGVCRLAHARWETFWACLPDLQTLSWIIPACALLEASDAPAFGLRACLTQLHLEIQCDSRMHPAECIDLTALERYQYAEQLTSLVIEDTAAVPADVQLSLGAGEFSVLKQLRCVCRKLMGTLKAPNLTIIRLSMDEESIDWSAFDGCRLLQSIHVTNSGHFDCRGCTFPKSLEHLWLSVGCMLEDGCFGEGHTDLHSLSTMHVSFIVRGSVFNLQSFAFGRKKVDVTVGDSDILDIYSPPSHDALWRLVDP